MNFLTSFFDDIFFDKFLGLVFAPNFFNEFLRRIFFATNFDEFFKVSLDYLNYYELLDRSTWLQSCFLLEYKKIWHSSKKSALIS